jgi:tRNA(fMet)-specific endonuclease VapC
LKAVTIITAEEQLRGWLAAIRQASATPKLVWAYARLRAALDYFKSVQLLDFNQTAYTRYEELRRQKIRIGTQDLRIAAVVLAMNGILVTRNQHDFTQVPGLVFQDWTLP